MIISSNNYSIDVFHNAAILDQGSRNKQKFRLLKQAIDSCQVLGLNCEFGVHEGFTINRIAKFIGDEIIYGFDSFEGLPESWQMNDSISLDQGHFAIPELPLVAPNVRLVKGWFETSIPIWQLTHKDTIKFIHIDCDLYSSTKTVLNALNNQIFPGSVIVFDEFYYWARPNEYTNWADHEYRALGEWISDHNRKFEIICRNNFFQCAIRITQ